jgi:signal transduction histidine kinase
LLFILLIALIFELLILLIGFSHHFIKRLYAQKHLEKQIVTKQIETQEQERKKIAEDLHDDLGSTLALLKEQIGINQTNATQIAEKAIKDLRQISHQLVPLDFYAFGFMPSLNKHVQNLKETGMNIVLINFGEPKKLAIDVELNIYRIIVELLHNIKKHSQHKEATLQVIYHPNLLHVAIERQHKEIKKPKPGNSEGLGERSILARIDYINARIIEKGTPENGYSFVFEVPY